MFEVSAKVLADSVNEAGNRLTTMEVTGHRFILAEFNTHRAFSRNSASSRAIPYKKMREKVMNQLAYPVSWPAEQKGMQGGAELSAEKAEIAKNIWYYAMEAALDKADSLHSLGVHKSVINRLLEPFLPHTIIVTATEWDGFWAQRCHPDAQPEIRALANKMKEAYDASYPMRLPAHGWHLPLIQEDEHELDINTKMKISVARCARVSYLTHDGKRDLFADINLYHRLADHTPAHASPFEHVARPEDGSGNFASGNFRGWTQLRHILELD